jgi:hypothetical protein
MAPSIERQHVSDKQDAGTKHTPQHFLTTQRLCQHYIIRTFCHMFYLRYNNIGQSNATLTLTLQN